MTHIITIEDPRKGLIPNRLLRGDPDHPHKKTYHYCLRCNAQYSLGWPYQLCNSPARDLCDDCIINLNITEFYDETRKRDYDRNVEHIKLSLDNPKDILRIIREKLL